MKLLKYLIIILFSFITSAITAELDLTKEEVQWIKNNPIIKLGADYKWPPFDFADDSGNHTGLASEYIKLISKKSNLQFDVTTGIWSNILKDMKSKKYDALTCAVETDERKKYLKFTDPYLKVPMVIITTVKNSDIKTIDDLMTKSISLNKSSYIHEWIKTKYPKINIHLTTSSEASLEAVLLGKVDAYIGNLASSTYIMNKYLLNNLKIVSKLKGFNTAVGLAIDKSNPMLFNIIQKSLKSITPDEHQRVKSKWKSSSIKNKDLQIVFTKKQQEWIKKHKIIKFVIDKSWKPIEYISKSNAAYEGITSEYIDLVSKKIGIEFKRVPTASWAQSIEKINLKEADLYSCVVKTPSRQKVVNFSIPYIKIPQVFVTNKDISFISDIKSLYGKKVALVKGYYITELIKREHPQIKIMEVQSIIDAFNILTRGEAYAYIDILPVSSYYIQKEGYSNLKISGMSGYASNFSMALRNDWDKEGIEIINMALSSITQEEKNKIYNKWLLVKYDKEVDYTLLWQIVGFFILLIIASFFWNRKLSVEIEKRKLAQKELLKLNKKLEKATDIAQSANKAKSDFLSNMSHEIRTPMNAILGFAELLDENIEDKRLKSFIKTIRSSGQTLLFLINDILDLSKIESGKLELMKSKVNINNLLEETIEIFKLQAELKGLELKLYIENKIPHTMLIDSQRFQEILINLIGNALKFTEHGHIKIIVEIHKLDKDTNKIDLIIKVKDSGIGIAPSQQDKIFNIFEQTDNQNTKKYGGTGLGLTISRKLANLMGGSLEVESELGKGSSFILNLKNIDITYLSYNEIKAISNIDYNSMNFESAVILIVDDIKENRDLVKENFYKSKIKILEAKNGEIAVDIVKNQEIDLILMDIKMPVMDGYTATKLIKEFSSVPIIALTASIMQNELKKLEGKSFNSYLRKPVSKDELYKEMSKFLNFENTNLKVTTKDEIIIDNIEELKEFLRDVNLKINKLYTQAIQTNDISLIKKFSKTLLKHALKYNIKYMIHYSQKLLEKIDSFEVDSISVLLNEYENKIKSL